MGESNPNGGPPRASVPTPYLDHDDAIVMIDPSALTRIACIDATIELQMRPVAASAESAARVVTTVRPLVIVAEDTVNLSSSELTDLAVSVGAQLVVTSAAEIGPALAERVKLAARAAVTLHKRREGEL